MGHDTPPERWTLSRAGIVNVYQYEDETLHFRGGRLLLRGVNGSGKSTAMNMLLPFLVDADPRRIDAAGQQSGVLASWMLSGRSDHQPVGYLWLEFARGDEWFVCGCGIRANRSTGRVTTWWFATERRPGIDFAIVENRVPLSIDALRTTLGSTSVFADDQRAAYRSEVRRRLFGGADVEQHISLLHVVRSPRVGDQIDRELPEYLTSALPELSEQAIADAAQPLDDLDDHRRNVEELTRTTAGLAALTTVYQRYARSELRRSAGQANQLVADATSRRQRQDDATAALATAEAQQGDVRKQITQLEIDRDRLDNELIGLRSSDAYREGANLMVLRERVRSLDEQISKARARVRRHAQQQVTAVNSTNDAHSRTRGDLGGLTTELDSLAALAAGTGLAARPPDAPAVDVERLDGEVDAPVGQLDIGPTETRLAAVRTAAQQRSVDVREMRVAIVAVDAAAAELRAAKEDEERAARGVTTAASTFDSARRLLARASESWAVGIAEWLAKLRTLDAGHLVPSVHDHQLPPPAELVETRSTSRGALFDLATGLVTVLLDQQARLGAQADAQRIEVQEAKETLDELERRREPNPPLTSWQRHEVRRPRLADLVDFSEHLAPAERAGLEAAMEAAGLLGAEVSDGGTALVLETGELLAVGGGTVDNPLGALLTVTLPDDGTGAVETSVVGAVLAAISTTPGDGSQTAVATDGTFQIGALRGRHRKDIAEHIGATARRAQLERQRAAARDALQQAEHALAATETGLATVGAQRTSVEGHRKELPDTHPVDTSALAVDAAQEGLDRARMLLGDATATVSAAEERVSEAESELHRRGGTLHLPAVTVELDGVAESLRQAGSACDRAVSQARVALRAFGDWVAALRRWQQAAEEHDASRQTLADLEAEREPVEMQLATLEDSIGLDYAEVLATIETSQADLQTTQANLKAARAAAEHNAATVATRQGELNQARADRQEADLRCVRGVGHLRGVLATQGLVAAAQIDPSAPLDLGPDEATDRLPTVAQSVEGLRSLATAVLAQVPEPSDGESTADGVRNSLRQRRDALAAGWDAEDRQRDTSLPMSIEVVGPPVGRVPLADALTRVSAQLRDQESLLTQKQNQALRNLLQGLVATEVANRLHAASELVQRINRRLETVTTSHGVGVRLRWRRRDDLDNELARTVDLLSKLPDLRSPEEDEELSKSLSVRLDDARRLDGEASYRELIERVLDYRQWFEMGVLVRRPGRNEEKLTRRTPLSEGEKKLVTYLPLFAAVAASCDGLALGDAGAARFLVLDDAFAKVSEDNHAGLFRLLVDFDLDFIATSERLWGTHASVPSLAITEVLRDADLGVIVLEHATWDGTQLRVDP